MTRFLAGALIGSAIGYALAVLQANLAALGWNEPIDLTDSAVERRIRQYGGPLEWNETGEWLEPVGV